MFTSNKKTITDDGSYQYKSRSILNTTNIMESAGRVLLLILCCISLIPQIAAQSEKIHYNAFSHNDYWREHPLFDALSYKFNCVEADLWLIDGELYVSHERPEKKSSITFENLYLKPLIQIARENNGKIYPESKKPFFLMVDFKEKGEEEYALLKKQIKPYRKYFCSVKDGEYHEGAILLFISGERPKQTLTKESTRYAFLDGTLDDLGKNVPSTVAPVVSDNYSAFFKWVGEGDTMPAEQLDKMRRLIKEVHGEGKLFRWWGAPDTEQFKRFFLKENVDLIGADDLGLLNDILNE